LSSPSLLAEVAVRYGYWVSMLLILLAAAQAGLFLYLTSWSYLNR
jgi:hypothetical protein